MITWSGRNCTGVVKKMFHLYGMKRRDQNVKNHFVKIFTLKSQNVKTDKGSVCQIKINYCIFYLDFVYGVTRNSTHLKPSPDIIYPNLTPYLTIPQFILSYPIISGDPTGLGVFTS